MAHETINNDDVRVNAPIEITEYDMTNRKEIELDVRKRIRHLDDEYYQQLLPKQRVLQEALQQLRYEEMQLLQLQQQRGSHFMSVGGNDDRPLLHQRPSIETITTSQQSNASTDRGEDETNQDDVVAARLAQALFQEDNDDSSSSDSSSNANPFI